MTTPEAIRTQVSETYTKKVETGASCCGPAATSTSCCDSTSQTGQKGVTADAGYGADELAGLPADAVTNSFGCGNPLAFSGVRPGQSVLDLGAGAGIDVILAAKKVGAEGHVIGIDMTDAMISRATANIEAAGLKNAEVRKGIIEELPVDSGSVDWVISNCVINLSPDKAKVFAEIARVLRPGGRISISDIVVNDLPQWARQSKALYGACVAGAISEEEYLQGLRDAGLDEVEVSERLVYEESQVRGLLESDELDEELRALPADKREEIVSLATGKIWSAKFVGQKSV